MMTAQIKPPALQPQFRCAVCHRHLDDPTSVSLGIGPACREKYGYAEHLRHIVLALCFSASGVQGQPSAESLVIRLVQAGALKMAERIGRDLAVITVEDRGDSIALILRDGYHAGFVQSIKEKTLTRRFKRTGQAEGEWIVNKNEKPGVWRAMCDHFDGKLGIGPKGMFLIEKAVEA